MSTDLGKGKACGRRAHGSPERVPGALFRSMATLFLRKIPGSSRADLGRELSRRLSSQGIHYDERTLKRHFTGFVKTVPPELETTMRWVLIESDGLKTVDDVERALVDAGLEIPSSQRVPPYISVQRILSLARLWLHLNPGKSKRSLSLRLHHDLLSEGVQLDVNLLQSLLAGKSQLGRRELLDKLLIYLKSHGIESEADALERWEKQGQEIQKTIEGRAFTDPKRFVDLCRLWKMRRHQASSRRLALQLQEEMSKRGVSMSLHHYQELVEGKARRVRRAFLVALEGLVRRDFPEVQNLEEDLAATSSDTRKLEDLCWVRAEPIAELAKKWIAEHLGISQRQLAIRVYKTVRRMGFSSTLNTIQSILGGWKKKTRGFVYRALLKQFGRTTARIPEQDLLRSPRSVDYAVLHPGADDVAERLARILSPVRRRPRPDLGAYIKEARRYLRTSAHSLHLVDFLAVRIERVYKISRDKVAELLAEEPDRMPGDADTGLENDVA